MSEPILPGWHGKLPALGDFASRRLPHEFIEPWDTWLAAGLQALREQAPAQWLEGYLASPIWRFLLLPGVLPGTPGEQGWAGVLMPSVDRAGRYFPFTVAWPLTCLPASAAAFEALHRWLHQLDDLAADALQDDWAVARLEAELGHLPPPAWPAASATGGRESTRDIDTTTDVTTFIQEAALGFWQTAASGQAFWWCQPGTGPGRLVVTQGLPGGAQIQCLLGAPPGSIDLLAEEPNTPSTAASG